MIMKKILSICLCLGLLLTITGCSDGDKKDSFDEDKIVAMSTEIIQELNAGEYQKVLDRGNKDIKSISTDALKQAMDAYVIPLGAFQQIGEHDCLTKDGNVTIGIIAEYEKGKIQYTLAFDQDDVMTAIYMKPVK